MAVFFINICKFNGCGITFPSLGDLIQHIEDTHIDYDPKVVEQKELAQPACLPLSYVLRFISEDARKESPFISATATGGDIKRKMAIKHHSYSISSSNRSNTPTGSEMDDDEMVVTESEDSNDSWTTEEFSSEFIMRYGSRHSGSANNGTPGNEKPFACPVPGCKKRYKNVNGIKYHSKNGHKKDGKVRKGYKCHCGKSYKTAQGLKNHALIAHNSAPENILTTQQLVANVSNTNGGGLIQRGSSPSQSLGSLSPSSISNMSSGAGSCHGITTNNVLQHLTNGGNGNTCLTTTSNVGVINLHQQQFSTTVSNNGAHLQHAAVAPLTEIYSPLNRQRLAVASPTAYVETITQTRTSTVPNTITRLPVAPIKGFLVPTSQINFGRMNDTPVVHTAPMPRVNGSFMKPQYSTQIFKKKLCGYVPNTPQLSACVGAGTMPNNTPTAATPSHTPISKPMLTPTFIEHKFSSHQFKERFLASARNNPNVKKFVKQFCTGGQDKFFKDYIAADDGDGATVGGGAEALAVYDVDQHSKENLSNNVGP